MDAQETIRTQIAANRVILYMKGTPDAPQCGFSGRVVQTLRACGLTDFAHVDVLADHAIREGIKAYSNWPTIPQLYVQGQLIGGCDIVTELHQKGELQKILAG